MKRTAVLLVLAVISLRAVEQPAPTAPLANSVNAFGLDVYRRVARGPGKNLLLSPYSIHQVLTMTYAGADGETRTEMQRILRLPDDDAAVHKAAGALAQQIAPAAPSEPAAGSSPAGPLPGAMELKVASRLYAQSGFEFLPAFLATLHDHYAAAPESVDFRNAPGHARELINDWTAKNTNDRIAGVIPDGALEARTKLVLVNAVFFRAGWQSDFFERATVPEPFLVAEKEKVKVPTMVKRFPFGYLKADGYTAVTVRYRGGTMQLLVLVPAEGTHLAALEKAIKAESLARCANLPGTDVIFHLPKLRFAPPPIALGSVLRELGMHTAFDVPERSANFAKMAPPNDKEYLMVSEVFHRTWLSLDEKGTEAAASTAATAPTKATGRLLRETPKPPIIVKVDRPFLFAIQHVQTGTCLFLGRVTDPR